MIKQNPIQIFKADQRNHAENEHHKLHSTFNEISNFSRSPFGKLSILNDETLAPDRAVERILAPGTIVMVIPLTGAVECSFTGNSTQIIAPGEAFTHHNQYGGIITIKNPYDENLINYLYITFSNTILSDVFQSKDFLIAKADLSVRNQFHKLYETFQNGLSTQIGIFNGQTETLYSPANNTNGIFAFVVSGTFEVQGRILEDRDGLALWNTPQVGLEALSDNAIMLLIETPFRGFTA